MKTYKEIEAVCDQNTELINEIVDKHLLYYAAYKEQSHTEFEKRVASYHHITSKFQEGWVNRLKAQYIAHRIFKRSGFINKFLNHSEIKDLTSEKQDFLHFQAQYPWRFTFSIITNNPAEDFYEMTDIFTGETFLVYSPGVTNTPQEQQVLLWFNLIQYNGECWQTYGPIIYYKSFEPDDIFFFATELRPNKDFETDEEIVEDIENNPVPYMMLLGGANYPLSSYNGEQLLQIIAEHEADTFTKDVLEEDFEISYNKGVYQLMLKDWGTYPHFCTAYYDENEGILFLYAMTDRGFNTLADHLNAHNYTLSYEPDIRINISMHKTAEDILKKKIPINPYQLLFREEASPAQKEELNKVNDLLRLAMPDINAGREPDIERLAQQTGVDIETARRTIQQIRDKLDKY